MHAGFDLYEEANKSRLTPHVNLAPPDHQPLNWSPGLTTNMTRNKGSIAYLSCDSQVETSVTTVVFESIG